MGVKLKEIWGGKYEVGDVLPERRWVKRVSLDCGCEIRKKRGKTIWYVETFCSEHDPTVKHEEGWQEY